MRRLLAAVASLSLAAGPAFGQAKAGSNLTRIGAAAAVRGAVKATSTGQVGRVVESGKPLFLNDHVTTDAAGRLQVLLLDETVFTLGPNSDMVLDEFVYDPANDAGQVAARVTKGVFKLVTGKIARKNPSKMEIKMPVGTIGIRGTIVIGKADSESSTAILMGPGADTNTDESVGAFIFTNEGTRRLVGRPGDGVTCKKGEAPSRPTTLLDLANTLNAQLEAPIDSKALKTGGGEDTDKASEQYYAAGRFSAEQGEQDQQAQNALDEENNRSIQLPNAVDGVSTWEEIRSQLTMGTGVYHGEGTYQCTGGGCIVDGAVTYDIDVDFGARTLSGGANSVLLTGGSLNAQSSAINATTFPTGGPASVTLNMANPNFNGTAITLINAGGVVARDSVLDLNYNLGGTTAVGSVPGTIEP
jgi:hypothetical protein